jgi:hypothetical protein
MNQMLILYPMLTLVGLAMTVLGMTGARRVGAVRARRVSGNDFKLGESAGVPADVALPNRNFMNLMEVPVLFYVVCLTYYVTQRVDVLALTLAWVFVGLRLAHSGVHLTYNNVLHRLGFFATANFVLIFLWVHLLVVLAR